MRSWSEKMSTYHHFSKNLNKYSSRGSRPYIMVFRAVESEKHTLDCDKCAHLDVWGLFSDTAEQADYLVAVFNLGEYGYHPQQVPFCTVPPGSYKEHGIARTHCWLGDVLLLIIYTILHEGVSFASSYLRAQPSPSSLTN